MAETVKITIPAAVATHIRSDLPREARLQAAAGMVALTPRELLLLLFCLGKDADPQVQQTAVATLAQLPDETLAVLADWPDIHPAILHAVALACGHRAGPRALLLAHPGCAEVTVAELLRRQAAIQPDVADEFSADPASLAPDELSDHLEPEDDEPVDEQGAEFLSKFQLAQSYSISDKIKMALTGDKEWRKILIKDANKLVSSGVLKNPRITEPEVLTVLKSGVQNDEVMRLICANKEWIKNYQIRKALIENPKTPLDKALRFLSTMNEKDIAGYAKSRNISSVIATQAKRMLLNKKR